MKVHRNSALAFLGALCVLSGEHALAQDLTPRASPQEKPVAIINATIHPISEPAIENGFIVFDKGVITGIGTLGKDTLPAQPEWRTIDAKGKHVYPGLIGAYTRLGLEEIQSIRSSTDHTETGGVTPEVQAISAINPDSTLLPVTRSAGELLAGVFPAGGTMPGRAGVIRLDGWTVTDMTVSGNIGLVVNWPVTRTITAPWMNQSEEEQRRATDKTQRLIDELFTGARAYRDARAADPKLPTDLRYEAIATVWGVPNTPESKHAVVKLPVYVHAQDYDQIQQAVALSVRQQVPCVIIGGREAPLCADLLKRNSVRVIVDGTFKFPKRDDAPYDDAFTLPARLHAAGIKFCIPSGEETAHERNLSNAAGMAVAYGLNHEEGLRAITLSAAETLGISDKYGSLAMNKSATLIVTDGDVLDVRSHVTMAFLDGRAVNLGDKQKALDERYRGKYGIGSGTQGK